MLGYGEETYQYSRDVREMMDGVSFTDQELGEQDVGWLGKEFRKVK